MMSRIIPYIACLLLATALGWSFKSNIEQKQQFNKLQQSIIAFNKANHESAEVITEIRERIKHVQEPCNCYNAVIPDAIIDRVHHNK